MTHKAKKIIARFIFWFFIGIICLTIGFAIVFFGYCFVLEPWLTLIPIGLLVFIWISHKIAEFVDAHFD